MKLLIALWFLFMGVAPLSWPDHDTWSNPWTILDWIVHLAAGYYIISNYRIVRNDDIRNELNEIRKLLAADNDSV